MGARAVRLAAAHRLRDPDEGVGFEHSMVLSVHVRAHGEFSVAVVTGFPAKPRRGSCMLKTLQWHGCPGPVLQAALARTRALGEDSHFCSELVAGTSLRE